MSDDVRLLAVATAEMFYEIAKAIRLSTFPSCDLNPEISDFCRATGIEPPWDEPDEGGHDMTENS